MFIAKKAIPRRTVLRGIGATLALPFLDSMVPALSALAQTAALNGCAELLLDEAIVAELETPGTAGTVPHTEVRVSLSAPSPAALDSGDFTLTVVCASRHAGTSVGRFLHLLHACQELPHDTR